MCVSVWGAQSRLGVFAKGRLFFVCLLRMILPSHFETGRGEDDEGLGFRV